LLGNPCSLELKYDHLGARLVLGHVDPMVIDLTLTTLETRRKRKDLIQTFKILKTFDNVDSSAWFKLSSTVLKGHDYKLF